MATILDQIIAKKKQEVLNIKTHLTLKTNVETKRSFIQVLKGAEEISVVAEFKRASPSKGLLNGEVDPLKQALLYEKCGAAAISVLTDSSFFKGSFEDLKSIREGVNIPVLCKDFLIDPIQIDMAEAYGADLILLIASALSETELSEMFSYATEKGLEVLVEVHNESELESALKIGAELIGVNNRNLKSFEVNLGVTKELGPLVKDAGKWLISESGIRSSHDVLDVITAGANAVLVGETMMLSQDLAKTISSLRMPFHKGVIL